MASKDRWTDQEISELGYELQDRVIKGGKKPKFKSRKCKICNTRFHPVNDQQVYCTNYCRSLRRHNEKSINRKCEHCGNLIEFRKRSTAKYCTDSCRVAACRARRVNV
jgi:poly-beta-hydroxyalkanoate depolymerase